VNYPVLQFKDHEAHWKVSGWKENCRK
jgi:hypothetical protein